MTLKRRLYLAIGIALLAVVFAFPNSALAHGRDLFYHRVFGARTDCEMLRYIRYAAPLHDAFGNTYYTLEEAADACEDAPGALVLWEGPADHELP